jgi:tRNA threonylcarbamoyladenosine biosynthesis protein TsaE
VVLRGPLGAGKTTLVRGAARALGVTDHVTSPTFTLAQRYDGRIPVAHLDAYRLTAVDDEEIGLALEVIGDDAIAFIEWPDVLQDALPDALVRVTLEHGGGDTRLLTLDSPDPTVAAALSQHCDHPRP